ncbi:amino acid ABC transporter permease [Cryobacterium frigoriphilum]|uniref:Amino acid ABC transporter permease n=1 Tax=Cryobacterium frigoriphilum TaxID=1259150 RepID=A0A4R8ZV49_9MICO|nr:amino acid ABC transporter permease [Cryobacterium frigoriphilum]TFD46902.1 amino acid ABC transporter permease [Cryobacterium frigoriphilum]
MTSVIDYTELFLTAVVYTIALSVMSIIGGTLVGVVFGFLSARRLEAPHWFRAARVFIDIYVRIFRSVPPLVLMFLLYFGVSAAMNLSISMTAAVVLALTLFVGAYQSENIRAGVESVPRGQAEASAALGLGIFSRMRYVEARPTFAVALPSMVGQWVVTIKDTSLASGIGVVEATTIALTVRQATGETWLVFLVLGVTYFLINRGVALLGSVLEKRISRSTSRAQSRAALV